MYRDKVQPDIRADKGMTQLTVHHSDSDICTENVLHAINMDYAAFYGNHHLSNNMAGDESDDDEPEQRTFSSHPYLIS